MVLGNQWNIRQVISLILPLKNQSLWLPSYWWKMLMARLRQHCPSGRIKIQTLVWRNSKSDQTQSKSTPSWQIKIHWEMSPICFTTIYLVYHLLQNLNKGIKIIRDNPGFSIATYLNFILTWNRLIGLFFFFPFFSCILWEYQYDIQRMATWGKHLLVQISMVHFIK